MNINLTIHNYFCGKGCVTELMSRIFSSLEAIMATQAQLVEELKKVTEQVGKIGTETGKTLQKVTALEALLAAGGNTTPEVDQALADLKAQAQLTDDMVPDAPTP